MKKLCSLFHVDYHHQNIPRDGDHADACGDDEHADVADAHHLIE